MPTLPPPLTADRPPQAKLKKGPGAAAKAQKEAKKALSAGNVPRWVTLAEMLPAEREEKRERKKLFDLMDPNGNGCAPLAQHALLTRCTPLPPSTTAQHGRGGV